MADARASLSPSAVEVPVPKRPRLWVRYDVDTELIDVNVEGSKAYGHVQPMHDPNGPMPANPFLAAIWRAMNAPGEWVEVMAPENERAQKPADSQ